MLRTLVLNAADLLAAHRVQDGFILESRTTVGAPLSFPGRSAAPEIHFAGVRQLLALNPPSALLTTPNPICLLDTGAWHPASKSTDTGCAPGHLHPAFSSTVDRKIALQCT